METKTTLIEELEWAAHEARAMARSSVAMYLNDQVTVYQQWFERLAARAAHVRRMLDDHPGDYEPEYGVCCDGDNVCRSVLDELISPDIEPAPEITANQIKDKNA